MSVTDLFHTRIGLLENEITRLRKALWEIATDPYPYDDGAEMQQLAQDTLGMTDEEVKAAIAEWLRNPV